MIAPGRKPWERQPDEHAQAFGAFAVFRDTPPAMRTLQRLASNTGIGAKALDKWRKQFLWEERVLAWDCERDEVTVEYQRTLHRDVSRRHALLCRDFLEALAEPVREFADRVREGRLDLKDFSDEKLFRLVADGGKIIPRLVELERLSHGMSTSRAEVTGADGKPLEVRTFVDVVRGIFSGDPAAPAAEERLRAVRDASADTPVGGNGHQDRWAELPPVTDDAVLDDPEDDGVH